MEGINTAAKQDEHSNPSDLLGNEKSLIDMDSFQSFDTSEKYGSDAKDDFTGDMQSFNLMSTTRPLITGSDEGVSVLMKGAPYSADFGEFKSTEKVLGDDPGISFGDPISKLRGSVGDDLLIGGGDDECFDVPKKIASSDISGASLSLGRVHESELVNPLAGAEDPKIVSKHKTESENYESPSAYNASAQPEPGLLKREVAMEDSEIANASKKSDAGCPFSPGAWFNSEKLHPVVSEYIYWRDPKKSGIAFGSSLILLLSLKYFSLISVFAYMILAVLCITVSFRIYKNVVQAVQKSNEGHPFKEYLNMDIALSEDKVNKVFETLIHHINCVTTKLRSLILVEDLVDTLKLGIFAWCLTYVGAWFNGMTIVILTLVAAFTLPKVYETNKAQIDMYADILRTKGKEVIDVINAKMPMGKKKKDQ